MGYVLGGHSEIVNVNASWQAQYVMPRGRSLWLVFTEFCMKYLGELENTNRNNNRVYMKLVNLVKLLSVLTIYNQINVEFVISIVY